MAQSNNAQVLYEAQRTIVGWAALTPNTARTVFSSASTPWCNSTGYEYLVRPAGLITGGAITTHADVNKVTVAAMTVYMPWVSGADADGMVTIGAGTATASRGVTSDVCRTTSITINSSGAITAVSGVDHTAVSAVRGAVGGPPYIPNTSIEIGQVKFTATADAAVLVTEIYQIPGTSLERWDYPTWTIDPAAGEVTFDEVLPASHTSDLAKPVYVYYSTPLFSPLGKTSDWVPASTTYSVNSSSYYGGAIGSASSSLGQASFKWYPDVDGISDTFIDNGGNTLWFKFKSDRTKSAYSLTQGVVGLSLTYPSSGVVSANVTVTADLATTHYSS